MILEQTLTILISNRTDKVFAPIVSKTSLVTSPDGNGVIVIVGDVALEIDKDGVGKGRSCGIGGKPFAVLIVDAEDGGAFKESSAAAATAARPLSSCDRVGSIEAPVVFALPLCRNDDEAPLGEIPRLVDGRFGRSFSFS